MNITKTKQDRYAGIGFIAPKIQKSILQRIASWILMHTQVTNKALVTAFI